MTLALQSSFERGSRRRSQRLLCLEEAAQSLRPERIVIRDKAPAVRPWKAALGVHNSGTAVAARANLMAASTPSLPLLPNKSFL